MKLNPYKQTEAETFHRIAGDISASDYHYINSIHPFRGWQDSIIGALVSALVRACKEENITSFYDDPINTTKFKAILQRVAFPRPDRTGPLDDDGAATSRLGLSDPGAEAVCAETQFD